ncbi:hypothetical protein [Yersinia ruckeri]|uniref:hypothetical protein n=1 Tax=Yersinia ruckeri TaxID=29486 RepID=UPI001F34332B|nr:hypothetical protein [Yersinia ruckeri]UIN19231.1 hypothetical protein LGL86_17565 [Yersinia ruckeri]
MTKEQQIIDQVIEIAGQYGGADNIHHLQWLLDQMVRGLAGEGYRQFVTDVGDIYQWEVGIAPEQTFGLDYIPHKEFSMTREQQIIDQVIEMAGQYGRTDDIHHLQWLLDQMVRELAGEGYSQFVTDVGDIYQWEVGIAPEKIFELDYIPHIIE